MTQQTLTNKFGCAKWIVDSVIQVGTHTTIQGALNSASAGDTIFIRTGTYTEDPVLVPGVNLCAYDCDALTPNVTIVGKCTMTTAGTVSISGVRFQTNSDFFLAVTGSAASVVNLKNCYFNMTNNTGISYTSSSSSSAINIYNCIGTFGTTGITLCVATGAGNVTAADCDITGGSNVSTATSFSTGQFLASYCRFSFPLSTSSTGSLNLFHTNIECQNQNATAITTAGTGGGSAQFCEITGGTATAISIGSGTSLEVHNVIVGSTNAATIAGAGTLVRGAIEFTGTSIITTSTQTYKYCDLGRYKASGQPLMQAIKSSATASATGDGTSVTVIFDTVKADVGSNYNNSSGVYTFPATGYYTVAAQVLGQSATTAMSAVMSFVLTGGNQVPHTIGTCVTGNNQLTGTQIVKASQGDTLSITYNFSGGTKVVGTYGGTDFRTCLSVWQIA